MKLRKFAEQINEQVKHLRDYDDPEIMIYISEPSMGGSICSSIRTMYKGIDWDGGKYILIPETPLVRKKSKKKNET